MSECSSNGFSAPEEGLPIDEVRRRGAKAQLKPIPTEYKGCLFRSRLEARWAVFLDSLAIEWHYEHDPYPLAPFGYQYLPDFYLPDLKRLS